MINLVRNSTFRFMAVYLILFALSVGMILGYVYWNTAGLLERQGDDTIKAEILGLAEQYRQGGLRRLMVTLQERSQTQSGNVYLLVNFKGNYLVGNLTAPPKGLKGGTGWVEFTYKAAKQKAAKPHLARAQYFVLAGGYKLLVGRDVQERRKLSGLIKQALIWALGFTLALGIGGGVFLSRTMLARVDAISNTAQAIMAGDLSERMVVSGSGDELDRLAVSLNDMLAQIEKLMIGMREVTDNVAHDLKTPLTRLRARIEDALRSGAKADYKEALEHTIEDADGLLNTFNALLSIARAEAGEARAGMEVIDAGQLMRDLAELYEPLSIDTGVGLTIDVEDELMVMADRQLLSQALANLIDNALKYANTDKDNKGADIALMAHLRDDSIILAVADGGAGIADKDRARVVERFVRLDAARAKPGNGLGLSLAAGIAKLHGGHMHLKDNRPGLRVELVLPKMGPDPKTTLADATKK